MPHTSANGYMFSLLNKADEISLKLSKEKAEKFKAEYNATIFKQHVAVIKGYVKIPNGMLNIIEAPGKYLDQGYEHVMTLKPK